MPEKTTEKPAEQQGQGGLSINKQLVFPVAVYSTKFDDFAEHRQGLLDLVHDIRSKSEGVKISNLNAWHSDKNFHRYDNPHVKWLNGKIGRLATACVKDFGRVPANYNIALVACWANVSPAGGWNAPHHHLPNHWSGVFYLDVEDTLNRTDKTDRSGKIEFLNPAHFVSGFNPVSGVSFTPSNGQMFLFEAGLQHLVHPHFSESNRISIAFNLNILEKPAPNAASPGSKPPAKK